MKAYLKTSVFVAHVGKSRCFCLSKHAFVIKTDENNNTHINDVILMSTSTSQWR